MYVYMHVSIYVPVNTYVRTHFGVYVCVLVWMYVRMCVCVYIYIYIQYLCMHVHN